VSFSFRGKAAAERHSICWRGLARQNRSSPTGAWPPTQCGCGPEKVIKSGLNSLSGKTAQSVKSGGKEDAPPSCVNPYYAAAITAGVRAQLLRAALKDPYAIVSFMTDAIVSMRELSRWEALSARLAGLGEQDGCSVDGVLAAVTPDNKDCGQGSRV
jgi:hypothetical protein